ncbi:MAG: DNA gyrase inhibitor YacG [Lautropia sp.]
MVSCPTCGNQSRYDPSNRWRPFCSERCRTIDLGAWASDAYVVPGRAVESDDEVPPGRPATDPDGR